MMKKQYRKPSLFIESFELAEHIAGPCNYLESYDVSRYQVTHRNGTQCEMLLWDDEYREWESFFTSSASCVQDGENFYCYNAFLETGKPPFAS